MVLHRASFSRKKNSSEFVQREIQEYAYRVAVLVDGDIITAYV
jgi:hypothetical protein